MGGGEWDGGWVRGVGGGVGIFREISEKFSGNFREISGKCVVIRKREIEIVKRQNNILMKGLCENNPTIMLNPPVKYLRKCNFSQIARFFPTPFTSYMHTGTCILYMT